MQLFKKYTILFFCIGIATGCHWFDDANNLDECSLNSSFPCPCDISCEGENVCVHTTGSRGSYGQCTLPCYGNHQLCTQAAAGFGSGICRENGYCAIACYDDVDCPPGMGCKDSICTPGELFDPAIDEVNSQTGDTSIPDTSTFITDTAAVDTATNIGDTADTDTMTAQRQIECVATCTAIFTCFPELDQPYSLQDFINGCVDDNWHSDVCGACRLNCDTSDCDLLAACFATCDELPTCQKQLQE